MIFRLKKILKVIIKLILAPFIVKGYYDFRKNGNSDSKRFQVKIGDFNPQIFDKTIRTGFERHYVYHTAWASRKLAETKPAKHIDISSSLYFVGNASAFVPIEFYDYRPADLILSNLRMGSEDLTKLSFADNSIASLSCMHTVEHIGLGRYGDPFDQEGDLKAMRELERILMRGGNLFFVVPVGKPRIEFNAHRIYSLEMIMDYFKNLELREFMLVPERGGAPIYGATAERVSEEDYGCGCFWFKKN